MPGMKHLRDNLHYIITIFILFGSISNNCNILYFHLFFCISTILHWATNNNKCFLSEYDYNEDTGYSMRILNYFGFNFDKDKDEYILNTIVYSCVIIPLLITLNKLRYHCHFK